MNYRKVLIEDGEFVEICLYSKRCCLTNEGMQDGWVVSGGEVYIKYEEAAEAYAVKNFGKSLEEIWGNGDDGLIYYTIWEDEVETFDDAYDIEGNEYEFHDAGYWFLVNRFAEKRFDLSLIKGGQGFLVSADEVSICT